MILIGKKKKKKKKKAKEAQAEQAQKNTPQPPPHPFIKLKKRFKIWTWKISFACAKCNNTYLHKKNKNSIVAQGRIEYAHLWFKIILIGSHEAYVN